MLLYGHINHAHITSITPLYDIYIYIIFISRWYPHYMPTTSPLVAGKNKLFHHPKFICTPRYRIPHSATPSDHLAGHVYPFSSTCKVCGSCCGRGWQGYSSTSTSSIHDGSFSSESGFDMLRCRKHPMMTSSSEWDMAMAAMARDFAIIGRGWTWWTWWTSINPSRGGNIAVVGISMFPTRAVVGISMFPTRSTLTVNISSST